MRNVPVAEAKARLGAYIDRCSEGPIVITRHGRPVAILAAPPEDPEALERFMLVHSPLFQRIVKRALKGRMIPIDEVERELGLRGRVATHRRARGRRTSPG